jgi:hypothetical protein
MKTFLISLISLCMIVMPSMSMAQLVAGSPSYIQVSVTTNTQILAFDPTRIDWTIHARSGSVNCIPGLVNGQASSTAPTTSLGYEFLSGSYIQNTSSPTVSLNCTSESGTATVDIWVDSRGS